MVTNTGVGAVVVVVVVVTTGGVGEACVCGGGGVPWLFRPPRFDTALPPRFCLRPLSDLSVDWDLQNKIYDKKINPRVEVDCSHLL